jgi:hypothetical protein
MVVKRKYTVRFQYNGKLISPQAAKSHAIAESFRSLWVDNTRRASGGKP